MGKLQNTWLSYSTNLVLHIITGQELLSLMVFWYPKHEQMQANILLHTLVHLTGTNYQIVLGMLRPNKLSLPNSGEPSTQD